MSYVKKLCDDYGLNENQLSKMSNISRSSLNSDKKNNTSIENIKSKNLNKLSKTLDASMEELYKRYK